MDTVGILAVIMIIWTVLTVLALILSAVFLFSWRKRWRSIANYTQGSGSKKKTDEPYIPEQRHGSGDDMWVSPELLSALIREAGYYSKDYRSCLKNFAEDYGRKSPLYAELRSIIIDLIEMEYFGIDGLLEMAEEEQEERLPEPIEEETIFGDEDLLQTREIENEDEQDELPEELEQSASNDPDFMAEELQESYYVWPSEHDDRFTISHLKDNIYRLHVVTKDFAVKVTPLGGPWSSDEIESTVAEKLPEAFYGLWGMSVADCMTEEEFTSGLERLTGSLDGLFLFERAEGVLDEKPSSPEQEMGTDNEVEKQNK